MIEICCLLFTTLESTLYYERDSKDIYANPYFIIVVISFSIILKIILLNHNSPLLFPQHTFLDFSSWLVMRFPSHHFVPVRDYYAIQIASEYLVIKEEHIEGYNQDHKLSHKIYIHFKQRSESQRKTIEKLKRNDGR
jgi:hypothetical protein